MVVAAREFGHCLEVKVKVTSTCPSPRVRKETGIRFLFTGFSDPRKRPSAASSVGGDAD